MIISGKLLLLLISAICLICLLIPLIIGIFPANFFLVIPALLVTGYLIYIFSILKEEFDSCRKDQKLGVGEEIMEFCGFVPNDTYIGKNLFGIKVVRENLGVSMNFKCNSQYFCLKGRQPKFKLETGQFYKVLFFRETLMVVSINKLK